MTPLEKRLIEDMKLFGYSKRTQDTYLYAGGPEVDQSLPNIPGPDYQRSTPRVTALAQR